MVGRKVQKAVLEWKDFAAWWLFDRPRPKHDIVSEPIRAFNEMLIRMILVDAVKIVTAEIDEVCRQICARLSRWQVGARHQTP